MKRGLVFPRGDHKTVDMPVAEVATFFLSDLPVKATKSLSSGQFNNVVDPELFLRTEELTRVPQERIPEFRQLVDC